LTTPHSNLPVQLSSFVGREREIAELQQLLDGVRLLTLVGAGGVGKTRLAVRLATELVPATKDGVWLVELAALADAALVSHAVAAALDIRERADEPVTATLCEALHAQQILLVLDNCEHLASACAELLEALLPACPKMRVVATGRQPLGVAGETTWRVPSLAVPDPSAVSGADEIAASEGVRLFLERTRSVLPGFALTDRNAAAVAQICRRLDGIPLAIELAAARMSALGVEHILARLDDRFRLLADTGVRAPERQRTLRATVEWSHDLLADGEKVLFRRLSAFAGGWSLEAAEAVCVGDGLLADEIVDRLARLVRQSLVLVEGQETVARYGLLETLRQYGAERLEAAGEGAAVRTRHLAWFTDLAQRAEAEFNGPHQGEWLAVLEREHDNTRAALRWALDSGAVEKCLILATAHAYFWEIRGHRYRTEARHWLGEALAASTPELALPVRAKALYWAGTFALEQFDFPGAVSALEQSLRLCQQLGADRGTAEALMGLGAVAREQGDYAQAEDLLTRSLELVRRLGDQRMVAWVLRSLGSGARAQADSRRALELDNESLAICRALGDSHQAGHLLDQIGEAERDQGELGRADEAHRHGMRLLAAAGCEEGVNSSRYRQARLARARGDNAQAVELAFQSLRGYRVLGNRRDVPACLDLLAEIVADSEPDRAARLFGAAEALRAAMAVALPLVDRASRDAGIATAKAALGGSRLDAAWSAGGAATTDESIELALATALPTARVAAGAALPLTPRELEVTVLVGRGYSNREISEALVVSVRTTEAHVTNVLTKLGLRSRSQLAVWAAERGLLA
jgi:non-specific serine/threonine protein kinase